MKRVVSLLLVAMVLAFVTGTVVAQEQATTEPSATVVYGGRLQSDMLFYAQIGVRGENAEGMLGIGWNNSIWLGGHAYFMATEGVAAFSGLELHILYPSGGTIELHPALPLGFAIQHEKTAFIVEALILPAPDGEQVKSIFALSFLFAL